MNQTDFFLAAVKRTLDVTEIGQADTSALEKQIDEMVYKLYDLTPEEIGVVEGKRKAIS